MNWDNPKKVEDFAAYIEHLEDMGSKVPLGEGRSVIAGCHNLMPSLPTAMKNYPEGPWLWKEWMDKPRMCIRKVMFHEATS